MKRILYLFYILIQCTWGLGQTIIGFFFFLIHIKRPHKFYKGAIQTQWNDRWAGLSLGIFIFVPNNEGDYFTGARVHEYGHNEHFTHLARQDYRYLSTETIGGFCGVHLGIFAHTLSKTISHADFDWTDFKFTYPA